MADPGGGSDGGRARPAPRGAPRTVSATRGNAAARGAPTLEEAEALADPTRYLIFQLVDSRGPCSVAQLTEAVGVHHTAVRAHLARLVHVGLVTEEVAAPSGRGRPPRLYRAADGLEAGDPDSAYRRLAALLTEALRSGITAQQVGREAGQREAAAAHEADPTLDPVTALVRHADQHGFEPTLDETGTQVTLARCPYADVAAEDPATICSLHLGLAEGITSELGGRFTVSLTADPACAGCRLQLTHRPPP